MASFFHYSQHMPFSASQSGEFRPLEDDDESYLLQRQACQTSLATVLLHNCTPSSQLDNQMYLISCLHCIIHEVSGNEWLESAPSILNECLSLWQSTWRSGLGAWVRSDIRKLKREKSWLQLINSIIKEVKKKSSYHTLTMTQHVKLRFTWQSKILKHL